MSEIWLVVELSPRAEGEDPDIIRRSISGALKGADVFIPAAITQIGEDRVIQYLVEGYAFVRKVKPDAAYRSLENCRFVQSLLIDHARHALATVPNSEIERLRSRMYVEADQGICVGDVVLITAGPYKALQAEVIEDYPDTKMVQVHVKLRSKQSIVTLPRSFLQIQTRKEYTPLELHIRSFAVWLDMATVLARWRTTEATPMLTAYGNLQQLVHWRERGRDLFACIQAWSYPLSTDAIMFRWDRLIRLNGYMERGAQLWNLIRVLEGPPLEIPSTLATLLERWQRLEGWCSHASDLFEFIRAYSVEVSTDRMMAAYQRWLRLKDLATRVTTMVNEINQIQMQIASLESTMLDNVIIDGFNLAFRCRFAPGLSDLKDSKGRPTGLIVGFLRSLAAIKKRYPSAQIHVCWDGSSQRRKDVFSAYKANRPERASDGFDQVGFVRGVLPFLGVHQAWNPQEEADDVIASLVRGTLKDDRNIIISTDRDLLQLVTSTTVVLVPESGGRKEIFFDVDRVLEEYGVQPASMPHLRAMAGDTSDNIPGVSRVPVKILSALVRSHGTVEGIFTSGLPGLTKVQYARLREAEAQLKLNVGLMTLRDVSVTQIAPNVDRTAALERIQDVEMAPEVVEPLFGSPQGFLK